MQDIRLSHVMRGGSLRHMNDNQNRQLLTSVFDALATGDARPFADAMAEDFTWRFPGEWSWARD